MSVDENKARSFPMLPGTAWWQMRARFQRSLPGKVDPQYVETVLGVSQKSATNITPAFRTLGLIDDNGKPTPLANEWRTDEGYAAACETILKSVYPDALRDAVPPDDAPDRGAAERWFIRERGVGQSAARQMASLYVLIAQRNAAGAETARAPRSDRAGANSERTPRAASASRQQSPTTATARQRQPQPQPAASDGSRSTAPALHIDVQVHIPSDATVEQIDAIFSSMAKHLYQQKS